MIIAIDGPAASGKSTIAKGVAKSLGYVYLDTGAMYRAITWKAIKQEVNLSDSESLGELTMATRVTFRMENGRVKVGVDEHDATEAIRSQEVTNQVSIVSKVMAVRKALVEKQRDFAKGINVVVEGRDIGTVVFPKAEIKIYLNASLPERTQRRHTELTEKGHNIPFIELENDIRRRDHIDSSRDESPLLKAKDAIEIDTTGTTIEQVTEEVIKIARSKTTG